MAGTAFFFVTLAALVATKCAARIAVGTARHHRNAASNPFAAAKRLVGAGRRSRAGRRPSSARSPGLPVAAGVCFAQRFPRPW